MREQPVTRGYRGYEGGVLEGLSEACDRFYNLIGLHSDWLSFGTLFSDLFFKTSEVVMHEIVFE